MKKALDEYYAIEKKIPGLMKSEESSRTSLMVVSIAAEGSSTTDPALFRKAHSQAVWFRQAAKVTSQELIQVEVECNAALTGL